MTAIALTLEPPPRTDPQEADVQIIPDLEGFTANTIVCGCNDDNPYR
ncbi:hypothetical protein [Amycolatopsis sp. NPDC051102]